LPPRSGEPFPPPNGVFLPLLIADRRFQIILNKEVMARLNVKKGDSLYLTEAPGGYRLTPYDPDFERQLKLAEKIMHDVRDILRVLSK
jgi:putative addiction module antidote